MYYVSYNEINLTDMIKVREVNIPSLPTIDHSSFDVFERDGNIYNGASFGNRTMSIKFIIQPDDPADYDTYVNDVKTTFHTKEEARFFCGDESLYIWCVPVGDIIISELGDNCAECEVELVAYDPYWYSTEYHAVNNEDADTFTVNNESNIKVYPQLSVGFTKDTTFVQIENQTNGKRILIGGIPSVEGTTIKKGSFVFYDEMESTSGWSSSTAAIDSGRSTGGSLSVTSTGKGLMCGDFGSASDGAAWHGCCYMKRLDTPSKDFSVRAIMRHNSSGTNGDPEHPFSNNVGSGTTGKSTVYYIVTTSVVLRKSASAKATKLCTVPKNAKVDYVSTTNGWAKIKYKSYTGYCLSKYLKKMVKSNTVSSTTCNYVTVKSTAIRATASKSAKNLKTVPAGKVVRVYTSVKYPSSGDNKEKFYKLSAKYEGVSGYVYIDNLVKASEYTVDYEYEVDTADDKTGVVEVYGFSSNNVQLFKLALCDDNEYWEFTYPIIRKNSKDFLKDKTVAPNAKTIATYDSDSKKVERILSGRYGDWNEFYGTLYIERINDAWYARVQKIEDGKVVKEIKSKKVTDKTNSDEKLSYIVLYIGAAGGADKASGMAVNHIEVKTQSEIDNTAHYNFQEFEVGDILMIDNNIPEVRLNEAECNELIDIGSDFFELEPGENTIKVASDDTPNVDVIWRDKFI